MFILERILPQLNPFVAPPEPQAPPPAPAPAPTPPALAEPAQAPDPDDLLQLFGVFAPTPDVCRAPPAKAPEPAPPDPKIVEMLLSQARVMDRTGHDTGLAGVDPALRKEVERQLAEEKEIASLADRALTEQAFAGDAEMTLEDLDPKMRKKVEHQMRVQSLSEAAVDDFDVKEVTSQLEKLDDPDERALILADLKKQTGWDLKDKIAEETDADSHYRKATDQLLSKERDEAERKIAKMSPDERKAKEAKAYEKARKIGAELLKSDGDKTVVFDTLGDYDNDPADVEMIRRAFLDIHPEQTGLVNLIDDKMSGDNEKEAIASMDMGPKRHLVRAAAAMRNSFTGFGRDNKRGRMKEMLSGLTDDEIKEMRDNPDQYGDIIHDVQKTMAGADSDIVDAYVAGKHDLAEGLQLREDIKGNVAQMMGHKEHCGALSFKELTAKLEKMDPKKREAAVAAVDEEMRKKAAEDGDDPFDAETLAGLVDDRWSGYDADRGRALLRGKMGQARAAEFMDSVDRKGTDMDGVIHSLADDDLTSKDPEKKAAAEKRRKEMEEAVKAYGQGDIKTLAYDEDKMQVGKDDRIAFDEVLDKGKLSVAVKLQRAIDDDDTEKTLEILKGASKEDLEDTNKRMPGFEAGQTLQQRLAKGWGPTSSGPLGIEVANPDGDASGNYIMMKAIATNGAMETWTPQYRALVDSAVYKAEREDEPSGLAAVMHKDYTGRHYDAAHARELAAAGDPAMSKERFQQLADNTGAASGAYHEQKAADADSFMSSLKMMVTLATAVVAPELLPVVTPLMSAAAIDYKEGKLGKHYKGEKEEKQGLLVDTAISAVTLGGGAFVEARQAAKMAALGAEAGTTAKTAIETAAKLQKLGLEAGTTVGESVARGKIEGKSWDEIMESGALGLVSMGASGIAGDAIKESETLAKIKNVAVRSAAAGAAKAAVMLPLDAAGEGSMGPMDYLKMLAKKAVSNTAGNLGGARAEHKEQQQKDVEELAKHAELMRSQNKGKLSEEQASALRERARKLGVPEDKLPKADALSDEELLKKALTGGAARLRAQKERDAI